MKRIFFIVAFFAMAIVQQSFAQDTTTQSQFSQLLLSYYGIKNALVAGNADEAGIKAEEFVKTANGISYRDLSEGNRDALLKDAGSISETKDIRHQREYFANFSVNMVALAKAVKLTLQPVYEIYCPMKKAYWLSSDKTIKNPYFGNAMLACGSVKETL
jgi:hypothetical protein